MKAVGLERSKNARKDKDIFCLPVYMTLFL